MCCVGSRICGELITRSDESYRMCVRVCVCVFVWSRNLKKMPRPDVCCCDTHTHTHKLSLPVSNRLATDGGQVRRKSFQFACRDCITQYSRQTDGVSNRKLRTILILYCSSGTMLAGHGERSPAVTASNMHTQTASEYA